MAKQNHQWDNPNKLKIGHDKINSPTDPQKKKTTDFIRIGSKEFEKRAAAIEKTIQEKQKIQKEVNESKINGASLEQRLTQLYKDALPESMVHSSARRKSLDRQTEVPKPELNGFRSDRKISASDAIKTQDGRDAEKGASDVVREGAFLKLAHEIYNHGAWSSSMDGKNSTMDFKVMKENEPRAFKNLNDDNITVTWDKNYSRTNEIPVPLNEVQAKIKEQGADGVNWDLTVYAFKSEPKNLADKPQFIVTDHRETADFLKTNEYYQSLGEMKIGSQEKTMSVEDLVGSGQLNKLGVPDWMRKRDIREFAEVQARLQKGIAVDAEKFIKIYQGEPVGDEALISGYRPEDLVRTSEGKPLERKISWMEKFADDFEKPDSSIDLSHKDAFDNGTANARNKLEQVKGNFAETTEGRKYNKLKEQFNQLYHEIEKRSANKQVPEKIADLKLIVDSAVIQLDAIYKTKEITESPNVKGHYERFHKEKFEDLTKAVEVMKKELSQNKVGEGINTVKPSIEKKDLPPLPQDKLKEGDSPARQKLSEWLHFDANLLADGGGWGLAVDNLFKPINDTISEIVKKERNLLEKGVPLEEVYEDFTPEGYKNHLRQVKYNAEYTQYLYQFVDNINKKLDELGKMKY